MMEIKVAGKVIRVKAITGRDLKNLGENPLSDVMALLKCGVVAIDGEEVEPSKVIFQLKEMSERDVTKVLYAILKLSGIEEGALFEGEKLYEDLGEENDLKVIGVGDEEYKLRLLTQKEVLALPKRASWSEKLLRRLAMSIVAINGEEVQPRYEDLLEWPLGKILALSQAYSDWINEGLDEVF